MECRPKRRIRGKLLTAVGMLWGFWLACTKSTCNRKMRELNFLLAISVEVFVFLRRLIWHFKMGQNPQIAYSRLFYAFWWRHHTRFSRKSQTKHFNISLIQTSIIPICRLIRNSNGLTTIRLISQNNETTMPSFQQQQQQQQHSHHHQQMDDYSSSQDEHNIKMENMATDLRKLD